MTYEFNVFLSFSSKESEIVKPIWNELVSSGLSVFWSDSDLKTSIGQSWFDTIQSSLINSNHFVLYCSENSLSSPWVRHEYETFFTRCFIPSNKSRRLVLLLSPDFYPNQLPAFLQTIQTATKVEQIISILGGTNIEKLKNENIELRKRIIELSSKLNEIEDNYKLQLDTFQTKNQELTKQNKILMIEHSKLKKELCQSNILEKRYQSIDEQSNPIAIRGYYALKGSQITEVYQKNRMGVHNQGHYMSVVSPQAIAKEGTLTLSVIISPQGAITGMYNAGALIYLNDNTLQLASIPFVRINGDLTYMLTSQSPNSFSNPDDFPLAQNYYFPTMAIKDVEVTIATPLAQFQYYLPKTVIARRIISPLLSKNDKFLPASVEEYVFYNKSKSPQQVTLVVPMPSLVNLIQMFSRPREQDYTFLSNFAPYGHKHDRFSYNNITGVQMGSTMNEDRMVIAVPKRDDLTIDIQESFRLRNYNQDLIVNNDGTFHHSNYMADGNNYGAAISITAEVAPGGSVTIPVAKVFDFPTQRYPDNVAIPRRYSVDFQDVVDRDKEMAEVCLNNYSLWLKCTTNIQENILTTLRRSPAYRDDEPGALRVTRLLFNELSYLLSNTSVLDNSGQARFLECFDYPFNNSADVDFYSKLLLTLFPEIELDLCQKFVDSINAIDEELRFYHSHISDPILQQTYLESLSKSGRKLGSDIHIYAPKKTEGAVYHDLGSLTFGNPLRDRSEYTWYNTSYWIDLFPKLALRVLRDAKYTGRTSFVTDNWATLKKGFDYLIGFDYDGDTIPEGHAGEVRNTFDNIPFAGVDVYDANLFIACLKAMIRMAEMAGDDTTISRFQEMLEKALTTYEQLWLDTTSTDGKRMAYYITCTGTADGQGKCTDVFTEQLLGLWQWIAMGERPFLPEDHVVALLKTIFINNRTPMGWAAMRKQDGSAVESDQGRDVWIASNYVLAQMLDYYGLIDESKEVYRIMDTIIFDYGNSLNTVESVRPEFEKQEGEKKVGPHFIVANYPRPGAIYDQLYLNAIKEVWEQNPDIDFISTEKLQRIRQEIFNT